MGKKDKTEKLAKVTGGILTMGGSALMEAGKRKYDGKKKSDDSSSSSAAETTISAEDVLAEENRRNRLLRRTAFIQEANKTAAGSGATKLGV